MEFSIELFAEKLKEWFTDSALFPYYEIANHNFKNNASLNQPDAQKHPERTPTHLKDIAKQCLENTTTKSNNIIEFEYGNAVMERNYPHYHILEDTQVIRKRSQGTSKTKGSQDREKILAKRDYGKVSWNGKTFTKEYSRNVRGSRNRMNQVSHWGLKSDLSGAQWENADSKSYWNVHYHYIENILDQDVVYRLASYFGLKTARKEDTGLLEEYYNDLFSGVEPTTILDIMTSFD